MKTEQQYFEDAVSLQMYMDKMEAHKENSFLIYNAFEVPQDDEFIELLKEKKPHILVITEDWCGDAMLNNPILQKIAEAANIDVRAVLRDENPELIDRYLTNGGRSIPMYLLLNSAGEVVEKWGPRAPVLQKYVMDGRAKLPDKDASDFEDKQKVFYSQLMSEYTSKPENWLAVYSDIRSTWLPVLQMSK
ncbi:MULTISPECIES: thioredoxin family protein [unclassified Sporosarcina]|uniref:thioredoxin family protein n=1 Tax=unclassified Sporosarcina TaxID=2647733 RepID=UPI000C1679D5|nr:MULTISPECIES: thioredoxin family protein [unclassified Sporosarcina]PID04590.1 thioredoxin family protein [Sporosarcina sp. P30]PID07732.1 thioredoxin family protein [Sporosarcina sp. P31]PID10930.1 thioredoxin family protein [Sporosarcina sp. P32b]